MTLTRRSSLISLAALASCGAGRGEAADVGRLVRQTDSPFPWPTYAVSGREALAAWEQLRRAGEGYPLIVGTPEDAAYLAEQPALEGAVGVARFPQDLLQARERDLREAAEEFGETYDPSPGPWPAVAPGTPVASLTRDILTDAPHPVVYLLVLPTHDPAEALGLLRYGGWNDCPPVEQHVAACRYWGQKFGYEPICVGHDTIEGRVRRRPADRQEALTLAREQYAYCADIVDQGVENVSALAAALMASDWWYFWWD